MNSCCEIGMVKVVQYEVFVGNEHFIWFLGEPAPLEGPRIISVLLECQRCGSSWKEPMRLDHGRVRVAE